jgi:hypothetical protein
MGEGWFEALEQVPQRAISMSIQQIMKSVFNRLGAGETKSRSRQKCPRRKSDKYVPRLHITDTPKL